MRLQIEQSGRVWDVEVVGGDAPDTIVLLVDGARHVCEARDLGQGRLTLRFEDGSMHDLVVETEAPHGQRVVHIGGLRVLTSLNGRRHRGAHGSAPDGPQQILAPMPGKVVRVPVQPGDWVEARQPVVVIEAMKMENSLAAHRAGTVLEVLVQEGMSVVAGRPLVIVG